MLLIFGNPVGGTPLMAARPTVAIDLPLKALAWEDADGKVWLTYNTTELLHERHGVPKDLAARLDPVGKVLAAGGGISHGEPRAFVGDHIKEPPVLMGKAIIVLTPHGRGDQQI